MLLCTHAKGQAEVSNEVLIEILEKMEDNLRVGIDCYLKCFGLIERPKVGLQGQVLFPSLMGKM